MLNLLCNMTYVHSDRFRVVRGDMDHTSSILFTSDFRTYLYNDNVYKK